ncbi:hypothetical protein JFV28_29690 [Pseudomonas sp. TH05]|uniref:hypothetical protein n=1 Tax=unclassified Pseudomonas TaxID=196821 RepID=UPI000996669E|nr:MULTISPECIES: hypothetical protein [unclassified Pseudomonas]MBK5537119.1 hypothetical protein [Pseudomonas sp. TH07]MBK5559992.1 hypothetical protein [Pseudomonas sp. TH05]OOV92617.1 hypothetical protein MF4836_24770 [Pseudomonas sp. MF4836]
MQPAQLFLIGLLATITTAALAADGSERSQLARDSFLLGQEQIHGDNNQQVAASGSEDRPEPSAPKPSAADEKI